MNMWWAARKHVHCLRFSLQRICFSFSWQTAHETAKNQKKHSVCADNLRTLWSIERANCGCWLDVPVQWSQLLPVRYTYTHNGADVCTVCFSFDELTVIMSCIRFACIGFFSLSPQTRCLICHYGSMNYSVAPSHACNVRLRDQHFFSAQNSFAWLLFFCCFFFHN